MTSIIAPGRLLVIAMSLALSGAPLAARETPCMAELIGEGRVASVIDARTLRLADGREVRLAAVEDALAGVAAKPAQRAAYSTCCSTSATTIASRYAKACSAKRPANCSEDFSARDAD